MSSDKTYKIITQGIPGSFHYEASEKYFQKESVEYISADSFIDLSRGINEDLSIDYGVMAIENSIAGSIIKNYKILRENKYRIIGEIYLAIVHNLMAAHGYSIKDIKEVRSHPMAINQCLPFLKSHNITKYVSTNDTALSAKNISEQSSEGIATIASKSSAKLYDLKILAEGIQSSKVNYTRFFIFQRYDKTIPKGHFNKASIYLRTAHKKGSLLKVLQTIYKHDVNISKLQSYPVEDNLNKYYFHIDLEYELPEQHDKLLPLLQAVTEELVVLGVYENGIDKLS